MDFNYSIADTELLYIYAHTIIIDIHNLWRLSISIIQLRNIIALWVNMIEAAILWSYGYP